MRKEKAMATKWKYATLPEAERLKLIREGNEDVFNEEKARTLELIKDRQSMGLDIDDALAWADNVGANNAAYKADKMGLDSQSVAKSGYGAEWLYDEYGKNAADSTTKDGVEKALKSQLQIKNIMVDAEKSSAEKSFEAQTKVKQKQAYNEALSQVPVMRERFANLGLSAEGGKVRTHELEFNNAIDNAIAELDRLLLSRKGELSDNAAKAKMQNLSDMLETLRNETVRIEQLEYDREQDKIANSIAKRQIAVQEANLALAKKKAANDMAMAQKQFEQQQKQKENESKLAAAKLILDGAKSTDGSRYYDILKTYLSDYFEGFGIDIDPYKDVNLTKSQINSRKLFLQKANMTDSQRYEYYKQSGLGKYMTFPEALA